MVCTALVVFLAVLFKLDFLEQRRVIHLQAELSKAMIQEKNSVGLVNRDEIQNPSEQTQAIT